MLRESSLISLFKFMMLSMFVKDFVAPCMFSFIKHENIVILKQMIILKMLARSEIMANYLKFPSINSFEKGQWNFT